MEDILNAILNSSHCQRNWDLSREIDPEHIKIFESAIQTVPSKQNIAYYKVHFITNRDIINKIYMQTATSKDKDGVDFYNPQVLANLLVAFEEHWDIFSSGKSRAIVEKHLNNPHYNNYTVLVDHHQSIGIAAGVLAFVANYLGYKTGFCKCFDEDKIKDIINAEKGIKLLLGIGYPKDNVPSLQHHIFSNLEIFHMPKTEIPIIKLP